MTDENNTDPTPTSPEKSLILLVEDDLDLREAIVEELNYKYEIMEAANGQQAIDMAFENIPDIIVSDIMMPIVDGVELCKKVKADPVTSHIPFIMLTSKKTVEDQVEGLRTGADHYITKPFHPELLEASIQNLLDSRRALRSRIGKEMSLDGLVRTGREVDKEFIREAVSCVEAELANREFQSENLAEAMNMSLRSLQRKLSNVIDSSPAKLISDIRMRSAAQMLVNTPMTITEIALALGIEYSGNFTKRFKEHHGMNPSEYRNAHRS